MLLHNMVCKEAATRRGSGLVAAGSEREVGPHGIGESTNGARRGRRMGVGMHAEVREISAEALLKERTGGWVQRLAGRAQDFGDDGRGLFWSTRLGAGTLQRLLLLFLACGTFRAVATAGALALERWR
jgi:hypothetical protein